MEQTNNVLSHLNALRLSKTFIPLAIFYFIAIAFLIVGYKVPFSPSLFYLYLCSILLWGFAYIYIYGFLTTPTNSFYAWLILFIFFPKQEMQQGGTAALFNIGFSKNLFDIGLFQILEIFIFISLTVSLIKNRKLAKEKISNSEKWLIAALAALVLKSLLQILFKSEMFDFPLKSTLATLQFFYGVIILFYASFLNQKTQIEKILIPFVFLGVAVMIEYCLVKFNVTPALFYYYSFNYRNAFKSIFMANDLMLGLFMMISASATLYLYFARKQIAFAVLFFVFNLLLVETFNRAHWMPFAIAVVTVALIHGKIKHAVFYIVMLFAFIFPLSQQLSKISPPTIKKVWIKKHKIRLINPEEKGMDNPIDIATRDESTDSEDFDNNDNEKIHYVYANDRFSTESVKERIGAIYRGIDLILSFPALGVGAGNASQYMSDRSVPTKVNVGTLDKRSIAFYNLLKNGEHISNAHNLFIHMESEQGFIFMVLVLAMSYFFIKSVFAYFKNFKTIAVDHRTASLFIGPLAFLGYYMFQATPVSCINLLLLFGILFLKQCQLSCKSY